MSRTRRVAVMASRSGTNLQALLDATGQGQPGLGHIPDTEVAIVLSDRKAAPALDRAKAAGVPAVAIVPKRSGPTARTDHERSMIEAIEGDAEGDVDLVVLAGFMRILSPLFVDHFSGRLINIHPALLPAFPGADAQGDAWDHGVKLAGCTTHFVDHDVDHGPIILQAAMPVGVAADRDQLARQILGLEHVLLPRTVDLYLAGRLSVEGRHVRIAAGDSWLAARQRFPEAVFSDGF